MNPRDKDERKDNLVDLKAWTASRPALQGEKPEQLEEEETQKSLSEELVEMFVDLKKHSEEFKKLEREDPEEAIRQAKKAAYELLASASPWPEGESRVGQTICTLKIPTNLVKTLRPKKERE